MAARLSPIARVLLGVISFTRLANMVLHDPALTRRAGEFVSDLTR